MGSIEAANRVLAGGFTEKLNNKLAVLPLSEADFHHPVDARVDLRRLFCSEELRTVGHDWVVRHRSRFYQILRENRPRPRPKDHVVVQDWLDGSLHIYFKDKEMRVEDVTAISCQRKAV